MSLTSLTGGLAGPRDPAAPLLTLHAAGGRVELSGTTTANWVAKAANLFVDDLGSPARVGLLLPLHWSAVVALLGAAASGAETVVARTPAELPAEVALVAPEHAQAALDAGCDEVFAVSGAPLGGPAGALPPQVRDFGREVPGHGDHFPGRGGCARVVCDGSAVVPVPGVPSPLLLALPLADGLPLLLGALAGGGAVVLVPAGAELAPDALAALAGAERAAATAGVDVPGLPRLG